MKRILIIAAVIVSLIPFCGCHASQSDAEQSVVAEVDDTSYDVPRYKLYPTENTWNLLELDTRTGRIWQVQYVVNSSNRFKDQIVWSMLDYDIDEDTAPDGRFELYPTHNMYNFLLVDQLTGRVWQIQWSTDEDALQGIVDEIE